MLNRRVLRHILPIQMAILEFELGRLVSQAEVLNTILPRHDRRYRRPVARTTGKLYRANGERECARRRAQIAAGRITAANGLA